jgi:hypothetical protein
LAQICSTERKRKRGIGIRGGRGLNLDLKCRCEEGGANDFGGSEGYAWVSMLNLAIIWDGGGSMLKLPIIRYQAHAVAVPMSSPTTN